MAEMKVRVDGTRQDDKAVGAHVLARRSRLAGFEQSGDAAVADGDVAGSAAKPGKNGLAAANDQI